VIFCDKLPVTFPDHLVAVTSFAPKDFIGVRGFPGRTRVVTLPAPW
jgi:hypothetical protein